MRKPLFFVLLIGLLLIFPCCSTIRYVPVNTTTTVTVKDTVTIKDTLVLFRPPEETTNNLALLKDTSVVETSLAISVAYVDPATLTLRHTITNKLTPIPIKVQFPEHHIEKSSITIKEVPVKVEVEKEVTPPWTVKVLIYSIVLTLIIIFQFYIKLKKRGL